MIDFRALYHLPFALYTTVRFRQKPFRALYHLARCLSIRLQGVFRALYHSRQALPRLIPLGGFGFRALYHRSFGASCAHATGFFCLVAVDNLACKAVTWEEFPFCLDDFAAATSSFVGQMFDLFQGKAAF